MSLSRDIPTINAVINHPAVRPHVGAPDAGYLDVSPIVADPENLFPMGEHGGFALIHTGPGEREVHTFITPEGRGRWALDAAQEMISLARDNGTHRLWTKISLDQPHVRRFAVMSGMKDTGETVEEFGKPYGVYAMELC